MISKPNCLDGRLPMLAVLNVNSGKVAREWPRIRQALVERGLLFKENLTKRPDEGESIGRHAALSRQPIIIVGGDGSINSVLNGLLAVDERQTPPCGIIPLGTANDFAEAVFRESGQPARRTAWHDAVERIVRNRPSAFDVGKVTITTDQGVPITKKIFGNSFSIGFTAEGARVFSTYVRRFARRNLGYLLAGFATLFTYGSPVVRVCIKGEAGAENSLVLDGRSSEVSCMNGRRFGGKFWLARDANPTDGLLNALIARRRLWPWEVLLLLFKFQKLRYRGQSPALRSGTLGAEAASQPLIERTLAGKMLIESSVPVIAEVDGELLPKASRFEVSVLKQVLMVYA